MVMAQPESSCKDLQSVGCLWRTDHVSWSRSSEIKGVLTYLRALRPPPSPGVSEESVRCWSPCKRGGDWWLWRRWLVAVKVMIGGCEGDDWWLWRRWLVAIRWLVAREDWGGDWWLWRNKLKVPLRPRTPSPLQSPSHDVLGVVLSEEAAEVKSICLS